MRDCYSTLPVVAPLPLLVVCSGVVGATNCLEHSCGPRQVLEIEPRNVNTKWRGSGTAWRLRLHAPISGRLSVALLSRQGVAEKHKTAPIPIPLLLCVTPSPAEKRSDRDQGATCSGVSCDAIGGDEAQTAVNSRQQRGRPFLQTLRQPSHTRVFANAEANQKLRKRKEQQQQQQRTDEEKDRTPSPVFHS